MNSQLKTEYSTFSSLRQKLVQEHLNEFVLIKKDKVINFYKSYQEALEAGLEKFGNVPFFIEVVTKEEKVHVFYNGLP